MNAASPLRALLRKLRSLVETTLNNVAGALLVLMSVSGVASGIRWIAERLDAFGFTWVAIGFLVACGLALFNLLWWAHPKHFRNPDGQIVSGYVVGFVLAVALFWTYVFGLTTYMLVKTGTLAVAFRPGTTAPLSDLFDTYLWYFIDLVPGGFNDAFAWGPDVKLQNGLQGLMLYLFRALILFQLFTLAAKLFAERRPPRATPGLRALR